MGKRISDMIAKFRGTPEERFLIEAERLYEKALATRGEVSGAGIEQRIHGRNNTAQLLADAINEQAAGNTSVFYYNKKEAQSLLHRVGLQLPGAVMPRDGFNHSIRENGSPVKPKLDNVTESMQFKRWFGDWQKHPKSASKVVDEDGKPLVVYHGTDSKFTVFDRTKTRANNVYIDVNEIKSVYGNKTYTNLLRIIKAKILLQK